MVFPAVSGINSALSALDKRGSIFSRLRMKSWSFSKLCIAGDWHKTSQIHSNGAKPWPI